MSVRGWAVGVASTAAVVAGLVGIQSGIVGTAALPILPHRAVAPSVPGGAELPAPAEVGAPPPSRPEVSATASFSESAKTLVQQGFSRTRGALSGPRSVSSRERACAGAGT